MRHFLLPCPFPLLLGHFLVLCCALSLSFVFVCHQSARVVLFSHKYSFRFYALKLVSVK
uniref:Uncharacterized protein n=1 Tax=Musa acuminata subsp. malaccensis TaxID=214687 RepID=A0A804V5E8_MUSAM